MMAVTGRNAAAVRLGRYAFTGFPAWVIWLSVHLYRLIGFRNRLLVLINWAWDYLFFDRVVRLILPLPENAATGEGLLKMEHASITTLFLDIGGVLLTNGWDHAARKQAADAFHLDFDDVEERHHLTYDTYEEGKLSLDEYLQRVIFYQERSIFDRMNSSPSCFHAHSPIPR